MPYAMTDNNRIIMWSYEKLDGYDTYFSNGEYIDENCTDGLDDFVIQNGMAIFSPSPEKEIARLKKNLADTDYIPAKIAEGAATREEYAEEIAQRQSWRDRINELERG